MSLTAKQLQRDYILHSATAKKHGHSHEEFLGQKVAVLEDHNSRLEGELALARNKFRKIADLESKIDLVLSHNTRLIKENEYLKEQLDNGVMQNDSQARLLEEIASLTEACSRIEQVKELEIVELRTQLEKRKEGARAESMEYYEGQIRKLKELLNHRSEEVASVKHELTLELERSQEEIIYLTNEIQHQQSLNLLSLNELKDSNDLALERLRNAHANSMNLTRSSFQSQIQKLKKELADRVLEVEKLRESLDSNGEKGRQEIEACENKLKHAQLELLAKEEFARRVLTDKEEQLKLEHEKQLLQIQVATEEKVKAAETASQLLKKTLEAQADQNCRRQMEQSRQRLTHAHQEEEFQLKLQELGGKLKQESETHHSELQFLKIKLEQLREGDVASLLRNLESQVEELGTRVREQEQTIAKKNAAINQEINLRMGLRKNYQQISGMLKGKYRELKIKFNIMIGENREQANSAVTRLQMNSQTLLNEAQAQAKSVQALEIETRRLQEQLVFKDDRVKELQSALAKAKEAAAELHTLHQESIADSLAKEQNIRKACEDELTALRTTLTKKQQAFERQVAELEQQAEEDRKYHDSVRKKNQELAMSLSGKDLQIREVRKKMKQQEADFSARCGFLESAQIESSAAVEEDRNKLKVIMSKNEVNLKTYYQDKTKKLEKDLEELRSLLGARGEESLRLQRRIKELEHKVEAGAGALQQQGELTKKIISMGRYQNNLMNTIEMMRAFRKGK